VCLMCANCFMWALPLIAIISDSCRLFSHLQYLVLCLSPCQIIVEASASSSCVLFSSCSCFTDVWITSLPRTTGLSPPALSPPAPGLPASVPASCSPAGCVFLTGPRLVSESVVFSLSDYCSESLCCE